MLVMEWEDPSVPVLSILGFCAFLWLEKYCRERNWRFRDFLSQHKIVSVAPVLGFFIIFFMVTEQSEWLIGLSASLLMLPALLVQLAVLVFIVSFVKRTFSKNET